MKLTPRRKTVLILFSGHALVILSFALAGCGRNEIKVQRVPKESSASAVPPAAAAPAAAEMDFHAHADSPRPQLKWTLPGGWVEKAPSEMRVASFTAAGPNGQSADVSVIPLPATGREVDLVNMWRKQMRLPAVTDETAGKQAETVTVGSDPGKLFDIASEELVLDGKSRGRMFVAMVTRGPTSWFFKMTGEDSFAREQKPVFVQFLKSISFESGDVAPAADPHQFMNPAEIPAAHAEPSATTALPPGWQEAPLTQFLLAKYAIAGSGGAKAEVNVSRLDGEGGGLAANVNRWRGQLGLPAVSAAELSPESGNVNWIEVAGGKAALVELTGTDKTGKKARLIGVVVPQPGETWFYKLMGDEQIVGQQKEAFTKFIQSARFSHAP